MSTLRPGASVRQVTNGAVLARAGRTIVVTGSPALEAVALILSASPASLSGAPEPVRVLLRREGLSTAREVVPADRPVAARADGDSWASVSGARWRMSGPGALVAAARHALRCWLRDAEVSFEEVDGDVALEISVVGVGTGVTVTVAPDGDGFAVLHTTAVPLWRAWRERVPVAVSAEAASATAPVTASVGERGARPSAPLDVILAVGSAFAMLQEQLAGVHDAARWMRLSHGTSRRRSLPPLAPSVRRVEATAIADPRPAADENGEAIDALTAGADDEFGWWTPPHPGELTQLPLALAESCLRLGPGHDQSLGRNTVESMSVIGAAETHDGAWVETALGVARVVAGGAAGLGTIAACADLVRVVGARSAGSGSQQAAMAAPEAARAQMAGLGRTLDSVHRSHDDPNSVLASHAGLVAGVENGDDRAAGLLMQAVADDCGVTVEPMSLGAEWDAAGVVVLRIAKRTGGDGPSAGRAHQPPYPRRHPQPNSTERSARR